MSTYIIGDIQGCYESLMRLLDHAGVRGGSAGADEVWLLGDLVNRGPRSGDVLRWAHDNSDWVRVILGNHDLHLLAHAAGAELGRGDTLAEFTQTPRFYTLIEWLRAQPLLHEATVAGRNIAMVHAGVNPRWSWRETRARARRIEAGLRSDSGLRELALAHPTRKAHLYRESTHTTPQWVLDLEWFTRVRALTADLTPHPRFKGGLTELEDHNRDLNPTDLNPTDLNPTGLNPRELRPWFTVYEELRDERAPDRLYFGHWAALGFHTTAHCTALDLGCIWGRGLGALRVEDQRLFHVPTAETPHTPKPERRAHSKT